MKLNEYMPPFLKNVKEFQEIFKSEDEQLEYMNKLIEKMLTEVIVQSAEDYGINRYEKIYKIDNVNSDIEERRFNIISKINNRAPFTLSWLDGKLKQLVGENNYKINIDYANYKVVISIVYLFGDIANTLKRDLRQQLPANLVIQINLSSNCSINVASIIHEKEHVRLEVQR